MSIFIGSFIWKNNSPSHTVNASRRTTSAAYPISTQLYIIAITNAIQTEIDTLSAGEFILQQFQADYSHLKKLHKRSDNAGNFSSHGTAEAEKIICKRVNF